jgi:hypothetical protein
MAAGHTGLVRHPGIPPNGWGFWLCGYVYFQQNKWYLTSQGEDSDGSRCRPRIEKPTRWGATRVGGAVHSAGVRMVEMDGMAAGHTGLVRHRGIPTQ